VAKFALSGRALEDAAHMAGLAVLLRVRAGERETRTLMVKVGLALFRGLGRRDNHEQGQYQPGEGGQMVVGDKTKHAAILFSGLSHDEPSYSV
jgi:hypothetical protein